MKGTIRYIDDKDRSYGLTGMAISMAVFNNGEKIMDINIDRSPEPINFSHDFFFSGNPRCSAKVVWDEMAENFHLAMAMAMGNLLSRKMLGTEILDADDEKDLKALVAEEGMESIGLEMDEIERLWRKDFDYLKQVFQHPAIKRVADEMAAEIQRRRVLSRQEINEILSALNRW